MRAVGATGTITTLLASILLPFVALGRIVTLLMGFYWTNVISGEGVDTSPKSRAA